MARAIHPGLKPAGLPDVAGVGSEYRDPSPTPHGAQRGARHLPANLSGPSYSARLTTGGATRKGAPACVDGAEDAQHAANSPLPLASPGQYPVMDARGADPRASAGTSGFPGSSQPQQRASNPGANDERRGEVGRRLTTSRDSRERPAISLRSSMVEHHRRRTARGAFDGLPCLRGPDHSALTARGARLVDGGDARSIRAGGAVDKTQTEPLAHPTRGSVPVLRRCA